jgi:glycogen(starch) synthase
VVHVVHNAIDSVACRREARQSPLPPGLEAHPYLLSVGKFETKKGHDVLIESYERIAPSHPDLWLVIIGGSGHALAACQARVAASPFSERMLLYCDVPHGSTLAAIARASLFAFPSRREPFGIVILEAAALATPVVASRVGGIPEIIQDGHSGVLVPPDDVAALAAALHRMLIDRERASAQAERLQETVGRNFSLTAQTLAYRELFEMSRGSTVAAGPRSAPL